MIKSNSIFERFTKLALLVEELRQCKTNREKELLLEQQPFVKEELNARARLKALYEGMTLERKILILSMVAIGEHEIVFRSVESEEFEEKQWERLLMHLAELQFSYEDMGGIAGYHCAVLRLLVENEAKECCKKEGSRELFFHPPGVDLVQDPKLQTYIRWGIENLPEMAEIYVVGGAGDRLGLTDPVTKDPLPAAMLPFLGKTLLQLLIQDLQSREYLYYKLTGQQVLTPILMMTSEEKNNDSHIKAICETEDWFSRSEANFFFFKQPLVPVLTCEGHWSLSGPLELYLKPGGHGVLWKLGRDSGGFAWLSRQGREKALIRQINNPIANTDFSILAFPGIGCRLGKTFGFSSCLRLLGAAEGSLVAVVSKKDDGWQSTISNIEYTDFAKRDLKDTPETEGGRYSKFPANTNVLFVDLQKIQKILAHAPLPGQLLNSKNAVPYIDAEGVLSSRKGGRLESTMQNISDYIPSFTQHPPSQQDALALESYVTYNERSKTISVTKNSYDAARSLKETPEGCFYEIMQNNHFLLANHCKIELAPLCSEETYLQEGPNCLFTFHPALGPLYSVISQKCRGGRIGDKSELVLDIAEAEIKNIDLEGSLLVRAQSPLGSIQKETFLYGEQSGKCSLVNVKIRNQGINREAENVYWKNEIDRKEALSIFLRGNAEFHAENVTFTGDCFIEVPEGYRYTAIEKEGEIHLEREKIEKPTWYWHYRFDETDAIILTKKKVERR